VPEQVQLRVMESVPGNSEKSWPGRDLNSGRWVGDSRRRQGATARANGDASQASSEEPKDRSAFTVAKLGPLPELPAEPTHEQIVAAVDRSISESCKTLKRDSLDCLLLHQVAQMNAWHGAIWRRLLELVQAGRIQRLGVSVQTPQDARAALVNHHVVHIEMPFNLLDWRWRESGLVTQMLRRRDLTVHAGDVFLKGLLVAADPAAWPAIDGVDARAVLAVIRQLTDELGRESPADLCMAYARGQEFIDGVVVGAEAGDRLDLDLRLAVRRPLTAEECRIVDARVPRLPERLLNPALWPQV